jgi:hypothetical protein
MKWLEKLIPSMIMRLVGRLLPGLSGPLAWVVQFFVNKIFRRVWTAIQKAIAQWKRGKEIKKEAKESVEPLKRAQTAEEIDAATDDALDGF